MPSCERTIKVVGPHLAGKKTLMGAMLYMCGLDLSKLEQLQKDGIHEYDKIIGYYQEKGIAPVFSAKTGTMRFSDSPQTDGVVYVLDAAGSNEAIFNSGQSFADPDRETFKVAGSLILAINKMDTVNWSRERYEQLVIPTIQQLKSIGVSPEKIQVVPISATQGDNILERSAKSPWHKVADPLPQESETSGTLFACLDRI